MDDDDDDGDDGDVHFGATMKTIVDDDNDS